MVDAKAEIGDAHKAKSTEAVYEGQDDRQTDAAQILTERGPNSNIHQPR